MSHGKLLDMCHPLIMEPPSNSGRGGSQWKKWRETYRVSINWGSEEIHKKQATILLKPNQLLIKHYFY